VIVDKPNLEDRQKLFAYYLQQVKYNSADVKIDRLARITVGQSPADISNIVREAALITVRNQNSLISMKEIDEARERIALGIKRRVKLSEKEKWQTAYHESGHAIITYLLAPSKDVFKITITPRGPTGGATWIPEREDTFIEDSNNLLSKIKISLGAYAAEKIKFNATTSGVYGDFSSAMHHAHNMVWVCGMGKSGFLGNWEIAGDKVSEEVKAKLDYDVQEILNRCLMEVTQLLKKEEPLMDRLAKELVAKDELNYDEIEAIFKEFGKSRP
jgi:cell division protease FtsH